MTTSLDALPDSSVRWRKGERLDHLFEDVCDRLESEGRGEHPAVVTSTELVSFTELDRRANQLAHHLVARGVRSGDRLGVLLDRCLESYVALLAVLKADAAYVPLDPGFPPARIDYIVRDAEVSSVLTLSRLSQVLDDVAVSHLCLDLEQEAIDERPATRRNPGERLPQDLCYVVYTSGSTGNPKGVAIEHSSICNFVRVAAEVYGYTESDRVYQGMTIAFDFSVEELWVPLIAGATLVPAGAGATLVGPDLSDFLIENRVTALCCVPTLLATMDAEMPDLRFILVSGEACPQDLVTRWSRDGRTLLNAYGPTEATVTATWTSLHPDRPVTIGRPLPTYSVVILDESDCVALAPGQTGEIGIAGIGLARGYLNRDDLTTTSFVPDDLGLPDNPSHRIYRTGDLGRINNDGDIEYLGRIDTQVKIRGYRIELTEIESVLLEIPEIAQAVVTVVPDDDGQPELAAYYTLRTRQADPGPRQLAGVLRNRLPRYMVPAFIEPILAIPMLPSHKADRSSLPAPCGPRLVLGSDNHVAPRNPTEEMLAGALADVLGVESVSVTDHLFDDLGVHSLILARLRSRLREREGEDRVTVRDFYRFPTIAALAAHIGQDTEPAQPVVTEAPRVPSRREYAACGAMQFLALLAYGTAVLALVVELLVWSASAAKAWAVYSRSVASVALTFCVFSLAPIALKWIAIGRWRCERIDIWTLRYFRFWLVRTIVQTSPLAAFRGTPLFNVYLRALGARIGTGAVVDVRSVPVCTDLLTIGNGAVLRTGTHVPGYRASGNRILTGPVTVGPNAYIGESCLLEIDSSVGANAQLGHVSTLRPDQHLPAGTRGHGSPVEETTTDFCTIEPRAVSALRRSLFSLGQLAFLFLLGPVPITVLIATRSYRLLGDAFTQGWVLRCLAVSTVLFWGAFLLRLVAAAVVPRVLGPLLREDRVHPLYGVHHQALRAARTWSNSRFLNLTFGDSSAIVHYLGAIGYHLSPVMQTGSNFGVEQGHDYPLLCHIGPGTMVADGLRMINADMSSTSFRTRRTVIGADNYLGNQIHYPPDGRTGPNCLLATKVMVPVDGPVRENVGLLGSPAFEIPRASLRDADYEHFAPGESLQTRLRDKNLHNLVTAGLFLGVNWLFLTIMLLVTQGVVHHAGDSILTASLIPMISGGTTLAYFIGVERCSYGFRAMRPQIVSIYDAEFWRVERYWKFNDSILTQLFIGTPFKNAIGRLVGLRVGRMVFDDGAFVTEKPMVEIGDYATLNAYAVLQAHSLEEGVFKADHIRVGAGSTIGAAALVHYGVELGEGSVLEPDSFLMKGETVPARSSWGGNPAQPVLRQTGATASSTAAGSPDAATTRSGAKR